MTTLVVDLPRSQWRYVGRKPAAWLVAVLVLVILVTSLWWGLSTALLPTPYSSLQMAYSGLMRGGRVGSSPLVGPVMG